MQTQEYDVSKPPQYQIDEPQGRINYRNYHRVQMNHERNGLSVSMLKNLDQITYNETRNKLAYLRIAMPGIILKDDIRGLHLRKDEHTARIVYYHNHRIYNVEALLNLNEHPMTKTVRHYIEAGYKVIGNHYTKGVRRTYTELRMKNITQSHKIVVKFDGSVKDGWRIVKSCR